MNLKLTKIRNTFNGKEYGIPNVNSNVLYICLESGCGYQVISELEAETIKGRYTRSKFCPGCGATLWKILK